MVIGTREADKSAEIFSLKKRIKINEEKEESN
jgi:hypothetical protein